MLLMLLIFCSDDKLSATKKSILLQLISFICGGHRTEKIGISRDMLKKQSLAFGVSDKSRIFKFKLLGAR